MSELKRYHIACSRADAMQEINSGVAFEAIDGDWVAWEDVEASEADRDKLSKRVRMLEEALIKIAALDQVLESDPITACGTGSRLARAALRQEEENR